MHRCSSGFLLSFAMASLAVLSGCLGNSSPNSGNGGIKSVSLSPSATISIDIGATQTFTASALDANGRSIPGVNVQFVVSVPSGLTGGPPVSLTGSGAACAGSWDITGTICNPGGTGIALVQAVANGVSSAPTTVYVHQHIASIQIVSAESQPPLYDCFSQGDTWTYRGIATNATGQDISATVGPMNWSFSNTGVLTTTSTTINPNPGNPLNAIYEVETTAKSPGISQLFATIGSTTSAPYPFVTCLVQYVRLQINGQSVAGNSITVNNGSSTTITATVIDTIGNPVKTPPLTWSTSNSEVALFSATTNTTGTNTVTARNNEGGAVITASCTPPSCNIGLPGITPSGEIVPSLPIYASSGLLPNTGQPAYGSISLDVQLGQGNTAPVYAAWAATTGCADQSGCTSSLFSLKTGFNPIGAVLTLPRTPNSLVFNHQASPRLYIGSDQGLMYIDVSGTSPKVNEVSSQSTPCNVTLCGKVLTVSNDGKIAVVFDPTTSTTPSQVYIYNASSSGSATIIDLIIPNVTITTAAFSPDQLKIFLLTDTGSLFVYSTVDALTSVPLATTATDVEFSADGSFAYVAGSPAPGNTVSSFATCDNQPTLADSTISPNNSYLTTPGIPLRIFPSPDGQHIVAVDPPYIDVFTTVITRPTLADGQYVCNPVPPAPGRDIDPAVNYPNQPQSVNLGIGNFVPLYSQLVNNGTEVVLVAQSLPSMTGLPAVYFYNIFSGQVSQSGLANSNGTSVPLAAAGSNDGSQVFVAACDQYEVISGVNTCISGSIHIMSPSADVQEVPFVNVNDNNNTNMCNNGGNPVAQCFPNLVAIQPQ
jgi:hypothetical protein